MKNIRNLLYGLALVFLVVLVALVLGLSIRGVSGNPNHDTLNSAGFKDEGPLELSPERGRFALTFSIIEDKSFQFTLPVARFITPDLGYKDGKFVSLFAPGVSLLVIPGYLIGKFFGISQVGAFAVISLIALLNVLLIRSISKLLGANSIASMIAGVTFLFATPAFAYAVTLYQHHITVFLMLASLYFLIKWKDKLWPLIFIWFFIGLSVSIDYPNFFIFSPIAFYAVLRLINFEKLKEQVKIKFRLFGLLTFIGLAISIGLFLWTNQLSYGDPFQLAGTVKTVKDINEEGKPLFKEDILKRQGYEVSSSGSDEQKNAIGFFKTRNMLEGLLIILFGNERGIFVFTPIMFVSILGIFYLYKKGRYEASILVSILGANILLYSMWGDPWGGWAFGGRYLIPSYSILSIFLAVALTELSGKILILIFFLLISYYSVSVNTLGALTTNKVPPKVEAVALEPVSGRKEDYTYIRNWKYLNNSGTKSFAYNTFAYNYITPIQYYYIITGLIVLVISGQVLFLFITSRRKD